MLELAAGCGVLKVGAITVAIDGTKVLASASKHSAVSYGRAGEMMRECDLEIAELLAKAETADSTPLEDGLSIPEEISRRQERKAKLATARAEMEARAYARAQAQRPEYEAKVAARDVTRAAGKKPRGKELQAPSELPTPKDQYNFTDPPSRIMKTGGSGFQQCYNEYFVNVTAKLDPGLSAEDAWDDIEALHAWEPLVLDRAILNRAYAAHRRYQISWWDSLIVAAAEAAACVRILSEDLSHGANYFGITVENPFKSTPWGCSGSQDGDYSTLWLNAVGDVGDELVGIGSG